MKIKTGTELKELDGKPSRAWMTTDNGLISIEEINGKHYVQVEQSVRTLGQEICKALVTDQRERAPEKMLKMGHLAQRLYGKDEAEITIDEAALIQKSAEILSTLVYTQIHDLIENGTLAGMEKDASVPKVLLDDK